MDVCSVIESSDLALTVLFSVSGFAQAVPRRYAISTHRYANFASLHCDHLIMAQWYESERPGGSKPRVF
jgi:hypothetical protein